MVKQKSRLTGGTFLFRSYGAVRDMIVYLATNRSPRWGYSCKQIALMGL
jgi:hypothetical protein